MYFFEAVLQDGVVRGIVKEKEQAKAEFKQAVKEGKQALLLNKEQGDTFSCDIGNLRPNERVSITLKCVGPLSFTVSPFFVGLDLCGFVFADM